MSAVENGILWEVSEEESPAGAKATRKVTVYAEFEEHREMGIGAACPVCGSVLHSRTRIPHAAFDDPVASRFAAITMGGDMVDLLKREFLKHLNEAHQIRP